MDEIERAGFRRKHVGALQHAERERAETERIAHADDLLLAHHHERKGTLDFPQRREHAVAVARLGEQMQDDLAVHGRLENGALLFQFVAQHGGVHEVAVVPDGELPAGAVHHERLGIGQIARSSRGVAHMADGARAFQPLQIRRVEDLRNQTHGHVAIERRIRPIGRDDARALLPAMLEGKESVVGQDGGVGMSKNGKNAALVGRFVVLHVGRRSGEARD